MFSVYLVNIDSLINFILTNIFEFALCMCFKCKCDLTSKNICLYINYNINNCCI